ncbi:hypothetical protein [Geminisphaera colitermitum]|uniref:hypothetical protein n=1 Tax=Geminisphaera colitermitum TaxID=1148786 RepID=UPI0005BAB142|nr:hypothetical protein [Geminisphaera colitermitum]RRK02498.1 hypothetical protein Ga0100230_005050 [Opitutaceae bacterium TAV3]
MTKRLDQKIARIRNGQATAADFIIADAKDADMAFGVTAPGPASTACSGGRDGRHCYTESTAACWKTLADYREQIREVIRQDVVDIMLLSASNLEQLGMTEKLFQNSAITPAARANDTTDIWAVRGGKYASHPSRAFRTASLDHIKYGTLPPPPPAPARDYTVPAHGADLGLYSITFTNNIDWDYYALENFHAFRHEAEAKHFRYFLEVFNPNVNPAIPDRTVAAFLNDHIVRTLAGVTSSGRPLFLKIPYNGPGPLEELVAYDPNVIVGILGGSAGTTLDAFQLIHDAQKYGARVALFGRKINLSEHPLTFIQYLRRITDGDIAPVEAVKAYHADLARLGIKPQRHLSADLRQTNTIQSYR